MKKVIPFVFLLVIISGKGLTQCLPDTTYVRPGIYPDTTAGLPPAFATHQYNTVITAVIPADTLIFGTRFPVDSIGVTQVTGLPAGFITATDSPSGFWAGGKRGCMLITGTPTHQQVGNHPLVFRLAGYVGGIPLSIPFDLTSYSLKVYDSTAYGYDEHKTLVNYVKVIPNPFRNHYTVELQAITPVTAELLVFDINSRLVAIDKIKAETGVNHFTFDSSTLQPGIYFGRLRLADGSTSTSVRMLKY